jgi:hypothetical protein
MLQRPLALGVDFSDKVSTRTQRTALDKEEAFNKCLVGLGTRHVDQMPFRTGSTQRSYREKF